MRESFSAKESTLKAHVIFRPITALQNLSVLRVSLFFSFFLFLLFCICSEKILCFRNFILTVQRSLILIILL